MSAHTWTPTLAVRTSETSIACNTDCVQGFLKRYSLDVAKAEKREEDVAKAEKWEENIFNFFHLPPELRDEVYFHTLKSIDFRYRNGGTYGLSVSDAPELALLQSCRKVNREYKAIIRIHQTLHISDRFISHGFFPPRLGKSLKVFEKAQAHLFVACHPCSLGIGHPHGCRIEGECDAHFSILEPIGRKLPNLVSFDLVVHVTWARKEKKPFEWNGSWISECLMPAVGCLRPSLPVVGMSVYRTAVYPRHGEGAISLKRKDEELYVTWTTKKGWQVMR